MFPAIHSILLLHSPIRSPVPPPCAWLLSAASAECSLPWRSHSAATQLPPVLAARNSLLNIAAHPNHQSQPTVDALHTCLLLPVCNSCWTVSASDNASAVTAGIDSSTSLQPQHQSGTTFTSVHGLELLFQLVTLIPVWIDLVLLIEPTRVWNLLPNPSEPASSIFMWLINTFDVNTLCSPLDLRVSLSALALTCSN